MSGRLAATRREAQNLAAVCLKLEKYHEAPVRGAWGGLEEEEEEDDDVDDDENARQDKIK